MDTRLKYIFIQTHIVRDLWEFLYDSIYLKNYGYKYVLNSMFEITYTATNCQGYLLYTTIVLCYTRFEFHIRTYPPKCKVQVKVKEYIFVKLRVLVH